MKEVLKQFLHSLYDFAWLSDQRKNHKGAITYFFILVFVAAILFGSWVSFVLNDYWQQGKVFLREQVPYFTAEIKDGRLKVGDLEQPYIKSFKGGKVVVDTVSSTTKPVEEYADNDTYDVVFLLTADRVSTYNVNGGKIESHNFKNFPNGKTDKNATMDFLAKLNWLLFLIIFLVFIFTFIGLSLAKAIFVLIWSGAAWLIAKIFKKDWTYKETLSAGAFALTAPTLLSFVLVASKQDLKYVEVPVFLFFILSAMFSAKAELTPPAVKIEDKK